MFKFLLVGAGGCIGAMLRYGLSQMVKVQPWGFPAATFLANLAGAFLIGAATSLALSSGSFDPRLKLFLTTGLCGGFTTFSTFSLELFTLLEKGRGGMALFYGCVSLLCCLAGVALGMSVGKLSGKF